MAFPHFYNNIFGHWVTYYSTTFIWHLILWPFVKTFFFIICNTITYLWCTITFFQNFYDRHLFPWCVLKWYTTNDIPKTYTNSSNGFFFCKNKLLWLLLELYVHVWTFQDVEYFVFFKRFVWLNTKMPLIFMNLKGISWHVILWHFYETE